MGGDMEIGGHDTEALSRAQAWGAVFYGLYCIGDAKEGGADAQRDLNELLVRLDALCQSLREGVTEESFLHKMAGYAVVPRTWVCAQAVGRALRAGAQVDAEDAGGRTALIIASQCGRPQMIKALLANGARVDHVDECQRGALHWAAWMGHAECARILLNHGALGHHGDEAGRRPWMLAAQRGNAALSERLLAWAERDEMGSVEQGTRLPSHPGRREGAPRI